MLTPVGNQVFLCGMFRVTELTMIVSLIGVGLAVAKQLATSVKLLLANGTGMRTVACMGAKMHIAAGPQAKGLATHGTCVRF